MSSTDAIVVGEGWISEHYFTTDAKSQSFQAKVVDRRKFWDSEAAEGRPTTRSRFTEARQQLEADLAALGEHTDRDAAQAATDDVHERLVRILGLDAHGLHLDRQGRVLRVSAPGITEGAPLAVVLASAVESVEALLAKDGPTLPDPVVLDDDAPSPVAYTSVARLVSALFVADDAPTLLLVLAGRWALLAERTRWAEGRYLAVDVQLVCERNDAKRGGEIDKALTCLGSESIAPNADGDLWWTKRFEESVTHTVGVSKDLREGVRLSIEIIANEVVARRRAKGLDPLPAHQAQPLAKQSLRFLYRILFLLYAEASPELGVLPIGAPEYARGYSLDRLRELVQVELATPQARSGTHLYDSLGVLFRLVDRGHDPHRARTTTDPHDLDAARDGTAFGEGLTFNSLRADLFRPEATAHIDEVGLGNASLQRVLERLLMTKPTPGKERGFISYAELGINQLGAVYEGLMSYTGFFAETDLHEVAKGGDNSKGSWVVPVERADGIDENDFVRTKDPLTNEHRPVLHERGTFVFRLAGRERQQSASYYTPEVLTRFTVGQALEELLDQDGTTTPAADILDLTVCEPALGSGAFAIEAVRQLAEQYLQRRQKELGERIDPDEYPRRLQEVKAYLALHNVYGVDLNATAVELAEISLWLDTMVQGLDAPWFGLHLRRGNSLIGARRAVFRRDQVTSKSWLKDVPRDVPLTTLAEDVRTGGLATGLDGGIHHFLLPAAGWGSAIDAKEAKELAPEALARLKAWRSSVLVKPSKAQVEALVDLSYRVEALWQIALQRLEIAEREIRRAIPVWGADGLPSGGAVQREQIEVALAEAKGAYQRLRRVMDAWCALWFWPLTDTLTTRTVDGEVERICPPTLADWIDALQMLLGRHAGKRRTSGGTNQTLSTGTTWDELGVYEDLDQGFASVLPVDSVVSKHAWLGVCEAVAAQHGFFHWNLDFATVFARGGFDLQVGNPPWVRPTATLDALLAEGDPWWQLELKPSEQSRRTRRVATLGIPGVSAFVTDGVCNTAANLAFLGASQNYPVLLGLQPDLYRCFMALTWAVGSSRGVVALLHPDTTFSDERAIALRRSAYRRLLRCWIFSNRMVLFEEVGPLKTFAVNVYGAEGEPNFACASYLFAPHTIERSLAHDGSGPAPEIKNELGQWDVRPHAARIVHVDRQVIASWHEIAGCQQSIPVDSAPMIQTVDRSTARVIRLAASHPTVRSLGIAFSGGWHERGAREKGRFATAWGAADKWDSVVLQGPNIGLANPMFKSPNSTLGSKSDWTDVDLEALDLQTIPITAYKPAGDLRTYDSAYTHWSGRPARDYYRVAWRRRTDNVGSRSLLPAIIPPGAAHVDGLYSAGWPEERSTDIAWLAGCMSSLVWDFLIRIVPKSDIREDAVLRLPLPATGKVEIALRALRLNCVTAAYSEIWEMAWDESICQVVARSDARSAGWSTRGLSREWDSSVALRSEVDRRRALLEIDVLVAMGLGLSCDDLVAVYNSGFPIQRGYDRAKHLFDRNGRLVPAPVAAAWRKKGESVGVSERTAKHPGSGIEYTYELPFVTLDREADMRAAYAEFERRLAERS